MNRVNKITITYWPQESTMPDMSLASIKIQVDDEVLTLERVFPRDDFRSLTEVALGYMVSEVLEVAKKKGGDR